MAGDITDADHREALIDRLHNLDRLDVLVNNAGVCDDCPIERQSYDDLIRVIDVNLISVLDLCRLSAPLLFSTAGASVINVSSIFGIVASRSPMRPTTRPRAPSSTSPATWPPNGVIEASGSTPWRPDISLRS
jgi:NAD(P)-dependent dehydrogenase (short-subunit alcohol dehydrogenase family)